MTVITLLETVSIYDGPIPIDLLFVGLDGRFKRFGIAIDKFLKYFRSSQRDSSRCSLVRKGVNIETILSTKDSVITLSPYGINSNTVDLDYIHPTIRSVVKSNENKFTTNVKLVEENQTYSQDIMKKINKQAMDPIKNYLYLDIKLKNY